MGSDDGKKSITALPGYSDETRSYPVDDHFALGPKNLGETIVSVYSRPAQMKRDPLSSPEVDDRERIVRISVLFQLGMSNVLSSRKYTLDRTI